MGSDFSKNRDTYIAKEDFTPLEAGPNDPNSKVLKIRKGDKLILKRAIPPNDPGQSNDVNWKAPPDYERHREALQEFGDKVYFMKNTRTKKKGFITSSYVAKEGTLECQEWYFGNTKRTQAMHFLSYPFNTDGSFLVRDSEKPNCYALTIKVFQKSKFSCKNYLIKQDNGNTFYISERQQYPSLGALIHACRNGEVEDVVERLGNICLKPRATGRAPGDHDDKHMWFIHRDDLEIGKTPVSSGNFGDVFKGQMGSTKVAIKTLKCDRQDVGSTRAQNDFTKETSVLKLLHHPNLVQCFGVSNEKSPFYMITEWLSNGDLLKFLQNHLGKNTHPLLNFDVLIRICENIASGMEELGRKKIIHRDLAARNVMLDNNLVAKVGDFGLARVASEYANEKTKFPVKWTAPEGLERHSFTCKSDVWSFGVTLWEIFSGGALPYGVDGPSSSGELAEKLKAGLRLKIPSYPANDGNEKSLNALYSIMLQCWQLDPYSRPAFDALHEDFANFDIAMEEKYYRTPREVLKKCGFVTRIKNKNRARKH